MFVEIDEKRVSCWSEGRRENAEPLEEEEAQGEQRGEMHDDADAPSKPRGRLEKEALASEKELEEGRGEEESEEDEEDVRRVARRLVRAEAEGGPEQAELPERTPPVAAVEEGNGVRLGDEGLNAGRPEVVTTELS